MKKNILIIVSLVLGASGLVFSLNHSDPKAVYIDTGKVYEKFNLSKELNQELEKVFTYRKHILDSLYENLRLLSEKIEAEKGRDPKAIAGFRQLEEEYLYKQKVFESENRSALETTNEKIWKQINQYTERFGKEMDYDYILGANGQGNIMYGKDKKNITDELVEYLNTQYDDKAK